mgnify:CR=1 FL=1
MPLSDDEQRILRQIEEQLQTDQRFAQLASPAGLYRQSARSVRWAILGVVFGLVLTVCDQAKEACPAYPARTERRHVSFPDPTGKPLEEWRKVRDALGRMARFLVEALKEGRLPSDEELRQAARL